MKLSDEFLWKWFGMPNEKEQQNYSYAITPYVSQEEYERDKRLLSEHNNAASPQNRFLMIHAAKIERTDKDILTINN